MSVLTFDWGSAIQTMLIVLVLMVLMAVGIVVVICGTVGLISVGMMVYRSIRKKSYSERDSE